MLLNKSLPLVHPHFRVWFRNSGASGWREQTVHAAAVDMRRPRLVAHCVLTADRKISVKIRTSYGSRVAEIRNSTLRSYVKFSGKELLLSLRPHETTTLQFSRDPGICLHLKTVPPRLRNRPRSRSLLLHFGPGIHTIPSGILQLQSNQTLHLEEGAVLRGRIECRHLENVVIKGLGIVDLLSTCPTNPRDETASKHPALAIMNSRGIRIEGITLRNPSHYGILLGQSENIRISHVSIFTHCLWGDGIDSMSCSNVSVNHCFVRSSDDCLAIYADRGEFRGKVQNHRYRKSVLWADVAHPVMIGVHGKHRPPGRILEDLRFSDLTILRHCEPSPMYQGCLALNVGDLNTARNVRFSRIRIEDPDAPRLIDLRVFSNPAYNPIPGKSIQNVHFKDITYLGNSCIPSVMEGYDRHRRVKNICIENLKINGSRQNELPHLRRNNWAEMPHIS